MASAEVGRTGGRVLARRVFPPNVDSLPLIRAFVTKWAVATGLDEELTRRINVAVSEACANVIDHSRVRSDVTVWVWDQVDRFTVDVWHAGEFQAKRGQDRRHRGMGLPLMVASADAVSFACLPEGGVRVSLSVFLPDGGDSLLGSTEG